MKREPSLAAGALVLGVAALVARLLLKPRVSFHGATVLITGGSRGLGLALARAYAREGARLILVARDRLQRFRSSGKICPETYLNL